MRWAGKMQWAFSKKRRPRLVVIVGFDGDPEAWEEDSAAGAGVDVDVGLDAARLMSSSLSRRSRRGARIWVRSRMRTRASVCFRRAARASVSWTWSFQIVLIR